MSLRQAQHPFQFSTQTSVVELTGLRACDLQELLGHLKTVPESVLYYHTHHFLKQHQYLSPEPPNDFAYWVTEVIQESRLGEQLASIDTVRFSSLRALRDTLVGVIERYLAKGPSQRKAPDGEEFHFQKARSFVFLTPYIAHNLEEFAEALPKVTLHSLYHHIFDARLRLEKGVNDFSYWLATELDEKILANAITRLDPYTQPLENLRQQILSLVERGWSSKTWSRPMSLDQYTPIVGEAVVNELRLLAQKLAGKVVKNINSTAVGGGVAEILNQMVPILKEMGIDARWDVIRGGDQFFGVTKKMHNALHGALLDFTEADEKIYWEAQETNLKVLDLNADIVYIHDPQPAGLIRKKKELGNHWIWRCHIDVSAPHPKVWGFLKPLVEQYDSSVFSAPRFAQQLAIPQFLIPPSIDPLSDKNKDLPQAFIDSVLDRFGLPKDKPLVTQVSRFDFLKDPAGVIDAYRLVKPYVDCRLLLVGGSASDDPEGAKVLAQIKDKSSGDPDIHILELPPTSHLEINALQRASTVILQKSLKEGFGLTVAEALWKGKPVIAGAVGGIPLQITHKYSGILTHSIEGTAYWLKQLLQSPSFARKLGENGREHVRDNFLLTRHLRDYLQIFLALYYPDKDLVYL